MFYLLLGSAFVPISRSVQARGKGARSGDQGPRTVQYGSRHAILLLLPTTLPYMSLLTMVRRVFLWS